MMWEVRSKLIYVDVSDNDINNIESNAFKSNLQYTLYPIADSPQLSLRGAIRSTAISWLDL